MGYKMKMQTLSIIMILGLLFTPGCQGSGGGNGSESYKQENIPWPSLADSPWPMFRHDPQGTAHSQFVGPQLGQLFLEVRYSGRLEGSPVVDAEGIIYFVTSGDSSFLYAIDPEGRIIWKTFLSTRNEDNFSTPVLGADGIIYVTSAKPNDEKLHAINRADGSQLWSYSVPVNTGIVLDRESNLYFIMSWHEPRKLVSLTPEGDLRWEIAVPDVFPDWHTPPVFSVEGSVLYASGHDSLYAISTAGEILWSYSLLSKTF
jgi:hypothetical protein